MNACRVTPIRFASRSIARSKSTGKSNWNWRHETTGRSLTSIDRPHVWQALYVGNEIRQQRRGIVPSPHEGQRQRHVQIADREDDHTFGTPPAGRSIDPSHAHAM